VVCTQKKKKTTESAVNNEKKKKRNRTPMNTRLKQGATMNKLFLVLALLLFALSACSVGKKCTYTQDGTKLSSYVWFYNGDKPIDLDKNNCG